MSSNTPSTRPLPALISRLYENESDLQQMQGLLIAGRSQSDDWHYPHIGNLMFEFLMVACHLNPSEHIRLWHHGEQLVGYAVLGEGPSFDWQVLIGYEWSGIETEALIWAEETLADLRKRDSGKWNGDLASGARQDNAERRLFLERNGFRPGSEHSQANMICSLNHPIVQVPLLAGYQVRAVAGEAEAAIRAAIQAAVWSPSSVGDVSQQDYTYLMGLPAYHRDLDIVAIAPDGTIVSYVNGWIDSVNRIAEFGPVGARPEYRRRGLTRAVLLECLERMQRYGTDRAIISTSVSNIPAIRLYESIGFETVNTFYQYMKRADLLSG